MSRVHGVHGHGHVSRVRLLSQQERQAVAFPSPGDDGCVPQRDSFTNVRVNTQFSDPPTVAPENSNVLSDGQINDSMLRMERKRKVYLCGSILFENYIFSIKDYFNSCPL